MTNNIHPSAVIDASVVIGKNVYIGPNCIIGFPAEYKDDFGANRGFSVVIEDNVTITGNVTIDAGSIRHTIIGESSFLMKSVYIAHDVVIGRQVILSAHTCLGGHVQVGEFSNIGMGAIIHPRQKIGSYCMIGMGSVVTKRSIIKPGHIYAGIPAKELGINKVGLERNEINMKKLQKIITAFEKFYEN